MLLLLSGEGATDIGSSTQPGKRICSPGAWKPGPMALLADQIFEQAAGFSALECSCAYFVPETTLTHVGKQLHHPILRGNNIYHKRGAQALACIALELAAKKTTAPIIAIYFHDCDGTRSTSPTRWQDLYDSMNGERGGFHLMGLNTGVPMIPKPKSEAWLLCAVKEMPYQHCGALENESGNDNSPHALKMQLQSRLGGRNVCDIIHPLEGEACLIEASRIDMPSFNKFKEDFKAALKTTQNNWRSPLDLSLQRACSAAPQDLLIV